MEGCAYFPSATKSAAAIMRRAAGSERKEREWEKTGRMERTKDKQRRRGVPADGGAGERRKGGPEAVVRDTRPRRPMASTDVSSRLFPPNKYERTRRPNQIKWFAWRHEVFILIISLFGSTVLKPDPLCDPLSGLNPTQQKPTFS